MLESRIKILRSTFEAASFLVRIMRAIVCSLTDNIKAASAIDTVSFAVIVAHFSSGGMKRTAGFGSNGNDEKRGGFRPSTVLSIEQNSTRTFARSLDGS